MVELLLQVLVYMLSYPLMIIGSALRLRIDISVCTMGKTSISNIALSNRRVSSVAIYNGWQWKYIMGNTLLTRKRGGKI